MVSEANHWLDAPLSSSEEASVVFALLRKFCAKTNSMNRLKAAHSAVCLQPLTKEAGGDMKKGRFQLGLRTLIKVAEVKDTLDGLFSFQVHQQVRDTHHSYTLAEAIFA